MAGALAHSVSATVTVALGGLFCIIGAIAFGLKLPALRATARELIVAQGMAGGEPAEQMTARVGKELAAED